MKKIVMLITVFMFLCGNLLAQELNIDIKKTWKECVLEGVTPLGNKIDAYYDETKGHTVERPNPLPDLNNYTYFRTRQMSILKKVPFEESKIVEYRSKNNSDVMLQIIHWNDKPVVYWHYNIKNNSYFNGRGTYTPDNNFEQDMVLNNNVPRFWHYMPIWFPDYYE